MNRIAISVTVFLTIASPSSGQDLKRSWVFQVEGQPHLQYQNIHTDQNQKLPMWRAIQSGTAFNQVRELNCASCHVKSSLDDDGDFLARFMKVQGNQMTSGVAMLPPDPATQAILHLPEGKGLVVHGVCPSNAALSELLQSHDIILEVNGESAADAQQVDKSLLENDEVRLTVMRDGKTIDIFKAAVETEKQDPERRYLLGIMLGELAPVVKSHLKLEDNVNVFAKGFSDDSAAEEVGVEVNDILLKIDGKPIVSTKMVQESVGASEGKVLTLTVLRDGKELNYEVTPKLVEVPTTVAVGRVDSLIQDPRYTIVAPQLPQVAPVISPIWPQVLEAPREVPKLKQLEEIQAQLQEIRDLLKTLRESK